MNKVSWLLIVISALFLLPVRAGSPVVAQDRGDPEANKAVLTAFFEAEAARDYDRMDEFFVEDFVRHSVATTAVMPDVQVTNLEQYVQFLQGMAATFPDYYTTLQMLVAEGDYVAFYAIWSGTFAENGNATGGPMVGFARFEDGKMAEMWVEWDSLTWTRQMMAPPEESSEQPISSINDVVGAWNFQLGGRTYLMELLPDGTGTVVDPDGIGNLGDPTCPACEERFEYAVEGNEIHFLSSQLHPACAEARYDAFVTRQGDQPVSLRFVLVGEDCNYERRTGLSGKTLFPAEP